MANGFKDAVKPVPGGIHTHLPLQTSTSGTPLDGVADARVKTAVLAAAHDPERRRIRRLSAIFTQRLNP
jgi:hypothetical protein